MKLKYKIYEYEHKQGYVIKIKTDHGTRGEYQELKIDNISDLADFVVNNEMEKP